ncbi:MAG: archaellin/type IV pilin N-terminal domain-containing protein [Nanoarchaeota archaeon]|nr:archaellin/type IV pilin N-terminal domain-containing protein [Nanoarchaeota archaeon]
MMNKKGVSPVIAFILLLSLAVTLGLLITYWSKESAETQVDTILTPISNAAECEQINININNYDTCLLKIYNAGTRTIEQLEINVLPLIPENPNPIVIQEPILPQTWMETNLQLKTGSNVEIFPFLMLEGKLVKCQKNKVFEIDCE